ncbi:unnamed protein product [Miscanthus lutarioriparius]|uniref:Uncharacterized protein n=1 Tax=Miscanthus lutarioriparius TaxID=422564 RepID=A0A811S910_9POAL|nr:unnamed protein product [Miscanthus lutarioriparius]
MARAIAALVLCAAVLVAAAHAGRVLEYHALEAGLDEAEAALAPLAAASPPASADVAADAGGSRDDGREVRERGTAIGDVLWFVLQWANEPASGDRRKAY